MHPEKYQRVRLLTDRFEREGLVSNALGYIIEIYDDGNCEVEFSDENGITYGQVVVAPSEIEAAEESKSA